MYPVVGSCPQCGAPIYSSLNWCAVITPPLIYSCVCNKVQQKTIVCKTTGQGKSEGVFKNNVPVIGEMRQKLIDNTNVKYIRNPLTY